MAVPAPEEATQTPLEAALARTAAEVLRCRDTVLRIEDALHGLIEAVPSLPATARAELQAIDLLDQRLADLARWLAALAAAGRGMALPGAAAGHAASLQLAEVRLALCGAADRPHPARHELF